jgi:hypothetical protein
LRIDLPSLEVRGAAFGLEATEKYRAEGILLRPTYDTTEDK